MILNDLFKRLNPFSRNITVIKKDGYKIVVDDDNNSVSCSYEKETDECDENERGKLESLKSLLLSSQLSDILYISSLFTPLKKLKQRILPNKDEKEDIEMDKLKSKKD